MKRFVQVGCGIRGIEGYAEPVLKDFKEHIELCGVYDINPKRAALVSFHGGTDVPIGTNGRRACRYDVNRHRHGSKCFHERKPQSLSE